MRYGEYNVGATPLIVMPATGILPLPLPIVPPLSKAHSPVWESGVKALFYPDHVGAPGLLVSLIENVEFPLLDATATTKVSPAAIERSKD